MVDKETSTSSSPSPESDEPGETIDEEPLTGVDPFGWESDFVIEEVRWRWVALGFGVIAGLHLLVVLLIAGGRTNPAVWITAGVIPYLVGGAILGVFSKGKTLLEPFYAAVVPAIVFPMIIELTRVQATRPSDISQTMVRMEWLVVLVPVLLYVLAALFTCWIVERAALRHGHTE